MAATNPTEVVLTAFSSTLKLWSLTVGAVLPAAAGLMETPPIVHLSLPLHDHDMVTEAAPVLVLPPPMTSAA